MTFPIPQAELPVMPTGKEAVLGGMCTKSPQLISVALQQNNVCQHCSSPTPFPTSFPGFWLPNLNNRGEALSQISPQ